MSRPDTAQTRQPATATTKGPGEGIHELEGYPDVLLVEEAAAILRLSKASVYRAVRGGSIPALKVNRRVLIPRAAVIDLLRRARQAKRKEL